jgi:hypothetical protein
MIAPAAPARQARQRPCGIAVSLPPKHGKIAPQIRVAGVGAPQVRVAGGGAVG